MVSSVFSKLYWLDQGSHGISAKVGEAWLDGSEPRQLYPADPSTTDTLTLDTNRQVLYWTEGLNQQVSNNIT